MAITTLILIIAFILAILAAAGVGGRFPLLAISVLLTIGVMLVGAF